MEKKRMMTALLAVTMCLGGVTFTGCKSEEKEKESKDESVTLRWVMMGPGKQKDTELVQAEFNKKLQEYMPGTKLEMEVINGSDYAQKWELMMASNEDIDIAWSGYSIDFGMQVQQGSYMKLDDLIDKYGQDMKNELPSWLFDLGKYGDNTYCVPNYQMMATYPRGVRMKKEYVQKYVDKQTVMDKYKAWSAGTEKEGRDFYAYWEQCFEQMRKDGVLGKGIGIGTFGQFDKKPTYDATTVKGFSIDTDTMTVFADVKGESRKLWYEVAADWYKKGYIPADALSIDNLPIDEYENGYCCWQQQYFDRAAETESKQKGVEIDIIPVGDKYIIKNSIPATSTVIPRTCKNPEKAMQLINLLNSKKGRDLYNLLVWGIEGKHYTKISENRIQTPYERESASSDDDYGLTNWATGNICNSYEPQVRMEGYSDYLLNIDNHADVSPTLGFKPDTSSIAMNIAQVQAVTSEYDKALRYGASADYKKTYDEYISKLDLAGAEVIREELQKQLDEWLKENK